MNRLFQSNNNKILYAFILILFVGFTGVIGFYLIEDFSLIDSLYMTVITVSTVGFQEVHDLSAGGRLFTIFLIITSLGAFAFSLSTLTSMFIGGELFNIISGNRRKSGLRKMENHVIICGYGRNGRQAVKELIAHNESFVIVDSNHELIHNNSDKNVQVV